MKRTIALPLTALTLVAAACTSTASDSSDSADSTRDTSSTVTGAPATSNDDTSVTTGGDEPDTTTGPTTGPIGFAPAALQQFGDCSAFLDYLHTEGAERVGPYGFGNNGYYLFDEAGGDVARLDAEADGADDAVESAPADTSAVFEGEDAAAAQAQDGGDDGTFSTTNVQVDGVDEPDIVKTDGDRILAITGETLHYISVDPDGATGTARGSIQLSNSNSYTYGYEIFLSGDRAFVFAQGDSGGGVYTGPQIIDDVEPTEEPPPTTVAPATEVTEPAPEPEVAVTTAAPRPDDEAPSHTIDTPEDLTDQQSDAEANFSGIVSTQEPPVDSDPQPDDDPIPVEPETFPAGGPLGYAGPQTLIIEIDLSNPDALAITNTMTIDGRYISARSIGQTARVVVTSPPQDLGFLYPSSPDTEDKAEEANREVVVNSTAEDWIPEYTLTGADGVPSTGQLTDCADVHAPSDFSGFDMLSIVSIDLGGSLAAPTGTSTVMATGDTVYASQDRMYVTTNIWEPIVDDQSQEWLDQNYQTSVHRFSIAGDGPAAYEASGSVEGHLLNQFSMNDRDGVFYAATTKGAPWSGNEQSESQIVALERNGDALEQVGSVGGLGLGEQIYSVRYVDTTAYVVTFRQVDPFYVVDLSDPRNMAVRGELKIPGYSSYLHPIGDGLVLGVGQDASDDGRTTGTKVSLFDVTDPANPVEVDVWSLPDAFSDAEFDHRAFLWWAPTNTAVLPLQSYSDRFSGAVVLNVTAEGITEQGRISHVEADDRPIGQTDCEVLTVDEIGQEENSEFFFVTQSGGQVQICQEQNEGGAVGLFCNPIPADEVQYYYFDDVEPTIQLGPTERLEICYPDDSGFETAIQRTMVIDGSIWTLSPVITQANALDSLDVTATLPLQ